MALMVNAWFMAPMEYSPYGKAIMAPIEYTLKVCSPNWKGIVLWKIVLRSGNREKKKKKIQCKRYNVNQN